MHDRARLAKPLYPASLNCQTSNGAELSNHLGYEKGDPAGRGRGSGNSRNDTSEDDLTEEGEIATSPCHATEPAASIRY
ncbi:hypothetical protein [Bradyrhizobium sp.]|uniref:hypothetical protein n=1 Tax=Bradyrhizobium sp. TaxID=376 RepID=UPI003C662EEC